MNTSVDMSRELTLHRHHNGVQLRRPSVHHAEQSLDTLLKKRISVFLKDKNHILLNANDHQAECINAHSIHDIIGKKFIDIINNTAINRMIEYNNNHVMNIKKTLFFNECIETGDLATQAISVKMPLYDNRDKVIGIFGFAYITETPCAPSNPIQFADTLNAFFESPQGNTPPQLTVNHKNTLYSSRETELIQLILRGRTMKEAACIMDISIRTAEHYFSNIKQKASVKTRSSLVQVLLNQGFKVA